MGTVRGVTEDRRVPETLRDRLRDERSGRVVFISHCLLNENTRYLGGAFRPGAVREVIEPYLEDGTGICQMPCPEQHAWGGVLKRLTLPVYGIGSRPVYRLHRVLVPLFEAYTRWRYRGLARTVVRQIADYRRSGFDVVAIVGVGASPSCGVHSTLDLAASVDAMAGCPIATIERDTVNRAAVRDCTIEGQGLFIEALGSGMRRRGLSVPFVEHDLRSEMPVEITDATLHP